jgi:hypothetical protein
MCTPMTMRSRLLLFSDIQKFIDVLVLEDID